MKTNFILSLFLAEYLVIFAILYPIIKILTNHFAVHIIIDRFCYSNIKSIILTKFFFTFFFTFANYRTNF